MTLITGLGAALALGAPVLKRSDVAFMYQASRDTYRQYGATVLAWGGTPTPATLAEAEGVRWFGSVGMVTEFAAYFDRFPDTYKEGLCRDVNGEPVKVPWLTDHQHKGVPYWWCCTRQPNTRTFLRERVVQTIKAGAYGLHVDDHLGTSGGLWLGICFCDRCISGFRDHLRSLSKDDLARLGIADPGSYDFRSSAREWIGGAAGRKVTGHPVWPEWEVYQCRAAAEFMMELRKLATEAAGRPVPVGANAGLLWPRHLADYQALDLFTAETDHHASERKPSDAPILAYRIAEAVGRPYASTASGWDWAYIKEHNLPGLVRCWIALSYASGQRLMAPHHQWCYTTEKGTHWYDGPAERFAPLYRFVRDNADLFDGYETYADVRLIMPHRGFVRDPGAWIEKARKLSAANLSFSIILAGDRIVSKPVSDADLAGPTPIVMCDQDDLEPADAARLSVRTKRASFKTFPNVEQALASLKPAARCEGDRPVRVLARLKGGAASVHLLNYAYDAARDDVTPMDDVAVTLDLARLGVKGATRCRLISPGHAPVGLPIERGIVTVPRLGLWGVLQIGRMGATARSW
ncbi:MAG: hypothetical protein FJX72_05000 [Armatimonadetes bacterium]|nr:hypothetical protein [Armatimonadota bacterium]